MISKMDKWLISSVSGNLRSSLSINYLLIERNDYKISPILRYLLDAGENENCIHQNNSVYSCFMYHKHISRYLSNISVLKIEYC